MKGCRTEPIGDGRFPPYYFHRSWVTQVNLINLVSFKIFKSNMEDELHHVQHPVEGLEQQLSCLAKGMGKLKREKEASFETKSYEHNSNDWYEDNRFGTRHGYMIDLIREFQEMKFHKRRGDIRRYHGRHDHYKHSYGSKNMYNEYNIKSPKVNELSQAKVEAEGSVLYYMLWKRHPKRNRVVS
ncbi:hypothetical protein M9H77_35359 [Catharanthus roseus]|uniref:Uncharacterized protein n=1 Tax=Catharanthus roseus TaxID=4058 RepID=A0ACB9ZNT4_CATRO|nr:hypothetical protein M9H77_35359 [Catharanthus roseus]